MEAVRFIIATMVSSVRVGKALRKSPTSKRDKERLRQHLEEQDRIIRIIKGENKMLKDSHLGSDI